MILILDGISEHFAHILKTMPEKVFSENRICDCSRSKQMPYTDPIRFYSVRAISELPTKQVP